MKIQEKLIVVTGASQGIGAAAAKVLAKRGGKIVLLARTRPLLEQVVEEIVVNGGKAVAYAIDLKDAAAVEVCATRVMDEVGVPDIVVHSAGAGRWLLMEETSPEDAVEMMAVPYFATFNVTRSFLPHMLAKGAGHLVVVNTPAAMLTWSSAVGYIAARWALLGFTNALRNDLRGTGLHVTSIVPGVTLPTGYIDNNPGVVERVPKLASLLPVLTPERVAHAIVHSIEKNRREVILPFILKLTILLHRISPRFVEWLVSLSSYKGSR